MLKNSFIFILAIASLITGSNVSAKRIESFDVVISNGRVMDPETGHDAIKNIGITDGKIVIITKEPISGNRMIDAKNLVVSPGFIDLHHHAANSAGYQMSAQDGVTTALELEGGVFPVSSWYQSRQGKTAINFGASVSHQSIRSLVFGALTLAQLKEETVNEEYLVAAEEKTGWMTKNTSLEQRAKMTELFHQGLEEGGLGFGYSLATTPGADISEMNEFYKLSAQEKVTNFIHIRSFGQVSPVDAGKEVVLAARELGASIHVLHINSSGVWQINELLDVIMSAQQQGLDVTTEVYPYTGAGSSLDDPRVTKESLAILGIDFNSLEVVSTGERLTEASFIKLKKSSKERALVAHIMDEKAVDHAVNHPNVMIASDSDGPLHPRGSGTYSRVLGEYVRVNKSLSLMAAINKMSLMPAKRLEKSVPQMKYRGRIQQGMVADITIFDPATVIDQATYRDAIKPSKGIAFVLVNGALVVDNYKLISDVYPGQAIKH